jgi:hypothetical protein
MEVIKLILPFLSQPKNYPEILKKLAIFALYETYIITFILRSDPAVNTFLTGIETSGAFGNVVKIIPFLAVINLSGIAIAILVAILSLTFQFHDRISDALGIRKVFDLKYILIPLATKVGIKVTKELEAKIVRRRVELVHAVFYRYATSSEKDCIVDKHYIGQALNAWSWFWVFVETSTYFSVGAIVAFIVSADSIAVGFLLVVALSILIAIIQRQRLPNYTRPEIDQILGDKDAPLAIRARFDAL